MFFAIILAQVDNTIKNAADGFEKTLNQSFFIKLLNTWAGDFLWLVGILTFVMVMYSAYLFMSAGADDQNIAKAKKYLLYSIVGAVVLILSLSVVSFSRSWLGV